MQTKDRQRSEIALRLRNARVAVGLTQAQAAQQLGVTAQAISNYERGTNGIEVDMLLRLCALYHTSPLKVLGVPHRSDAPSPAALALARDYDRLDATSQRAIRSLTDVELSRSEVPELIAAGKGGDTPVDLPEADGTRSLRGVSEPEDLAPDGL